jgi:hypothetical protein
MPRKGGVPENLRPCKKGQTANPHGRPKLPDINELLIKVLAEEKDGRTAAEAILMKLRNLAANGDLRAAEYLLDRGYGKPKQQIDANITDRKAQLKRLFDEAEESEL